jgi:hypothetical protein
MNAIMMQFTVITKETRAMHRYINPINNHHHDCHKGIILTQIGNNNQ